MNNSGHIRNATPDDLDRIIEIEQKCFTEKISYSPRQLRYLLTKANSTCMVQTDNDTIQGFIIVTHRRKTTVVGIETIDVDPVYRRQGIGQKLLHAAEQKLKQQGIRKIRLEVSQGNVAAIRLYEKEGFKTIALLQNYYNFDHDGSRDAYRMTKKLD